jgi:hypothetical protein
MPSRRWLYAGGVVVVLAAGAALAIAVTRGDDARSIVSDLTAVSTLPPETTTPRTAVGGSGTPTSTTTPPATAATPPSAPPQPVQTTPGNLLANGDFERDLGGWRPSGGQVDRVPLGHSGAWSVRIRAASSPAQPTSAGTGQPGILAVQAIPGQVGRSFEASAWVRASRPGTEAILRLRELGAGGESADVIGVTLVDAGWHEVAVVHQVQAGGRLTVEAQAGNLAPGEALLIDQVSVTAP